MIKRASALAAVLALAAPAAADAGFKEPVKVIWQHTGTPGKYYAWGVTPLKDLDRDGPDEVLSGAPRQNADTEGHAYLYSGRTGRLLHTFSAGVTGDSFGAA